MPVTKILVLNDNFIQAKSHSYLIRGDSFAVPGDKSALNPSGIRLGTPALTTRGFKEEDIKRVVESIHKGLQLAKEVSVLSGPKLVDFKRVLLESQEIQNKLTEIRLQVEDLAREFPMPGFDY